MPETSQQTISTDSINENSSLLVAVVQLCSNNNISENFEIVLAALNAALVGSKPDLICFPENTFFIRTDSSPVESVSLDDSRWIPLREWSQNHQVAIHIGATPLHSDSNKSLNGSVWISSSGEIRTVYEKVHLFDVDVKNHRPVRESDSFHPGQSLSIGEYRGWKIGFSICYDLRFSQLYSAYAHNAVDLILIPSAFLVPTGKAHWDILVRARAIESQAFVVAAAQGGTHKSSSGSTRQTYGHSLIVSPWGKVLAEGEDYEQFANPFQILKAKLSRADIAAARTQIPMGQHRRDPSFYHTLQTLSLS